MDCLSCATKIEGAARKVPGVDDVRVSIASQKMTPPLANSSVDTLMVRAWGGQSSRI